MKNSKKKSLVAFALTGILSISALSLVGCKNGTDGKDGINGTNGVDGTIWKSGTSVTQFTDAKVGDYFIDTDDYILYQKTATDWAIVMENYGKPGNTPQAPAAPVITINSQGYWEIDGTPTTVKAKGEDGETGVSPVVTIESGYWYINGTTTGVKAVGKDGSCWLTGNTLLTTQLGNEGDSYLDVSTSLVYSKSNGAWVEVGNLFENIEVTTQSAWKGKSAVFVGDSITYGAKCDGDKYWEVLKTDLELESVVGMGVGKSCFSATSDNRLSYEPLISRYTSIPNADLIQIFMGTNDYGFNTPLGTIADKTDISFYGALNVIIPSLQAKYPTSRIVFVTPLHRYGQHNLTYDYDKNSAGYALSDYVNAMKEVCERYSVPVIDLFNISGLNPSLPSTRTLYMPDGLHPNTAGHKYIASIMANGLNNLSAIELTQSQVSYEIKPLNSISLNIASTYYPSASETCRLSSNTNIYLQAGQKITLKDNVNFKYYLYAQTSATPTQIDSDNRLSIMSGWAQDTFTITSAGWYGITLAKDDMSEFDATITSSQTLADYFTIDTVKPLSGISLNIASTYYPSSSETCRLSSNTNIYLEAGQKLTIKDGTNFKYFLYAQNGSTPTVVSSTDRLLIMDSWNTSTFTAETTGWYGITMAKSDMSEFDATITSLQSLLDYFTIE